MENGPNLDSNAGKVSESVFSYLMIVQFLSLVLDDNEPMSKLLLVIS